MFAFKRRTTVFMLFVLVGITFGRAVTATPAAQAQSVNALTTSASLLASWLNQINQNRLIAHVQALQNCKTRHVNSFYNLPGQGIGAAYNYVDGQFKAIQSQHFGVLVWSQEFTTSFNNKQSTLENVILT